MSKPITGNFRDYGEGTDDDSRYPPVRIGQPLALPNNSMEPTQPAGCRFQRETGLGWAGGSSRGRSADRPRETDYHRR